MTLPSACLDDPLHHRVTLAGFVQWPDAQAAGGSVVRLRRLAADGSPLPEPERGDAWPAPPRTHRAPADGSFFFIDLAAGLYRLEVRQSRIEKQRWVAYASTETLSIKAAQQTAAEPPGAPTFVTLSLRAVAPSERAALRGAPHR